ncbi:MAG TPA: hypothetical protein VGC31_06110 [Paenirhodobacter sp.]
MLLANCGREAAANLQLLDSGSCVGWGGSTPTTERQFARAAAAEQAGRLCANAKLSALHEAIWP